MKLASWAMRTGARLAAPGEHPVTRSSCSDEAGEAIGRGCGGQHSQRRSFFREAARQRRRKSASASVAATPSPAYSTP